jgi:hypothetical protein
MLCLISLALRAYLITRFLHHFLCVKINFVVFLLLFPLSKVAYSCLFLCKPKFECSRCSGLLKSDFSRLLRAAPFLVWNRLVRLFDFFFLSECLASPREAERKALSESPHRFPLIQLCIERRGRLFTVHVASEIPGISSSQP